MMSRYITIIFILLYMVACGTQGNKENARPALAKDKPQELSNETMSILIQDMNDFAKAVKSLQQTELQRIHDRYKGVTFQLERVALFLNTYPDPAGGGVVFLVFPKDPQSGSNYLLTFDRPLPVIQDQTIELQIRTRDPEKPLECVMKAPDPAAYLAESKNHQFNVRYTLSKTFLQSGTYDFDALTVPSYRTRGYAFVVFDLVKAELRDEDAGIQGTCK